MRRTPFWSFAEDVRNPVALSAAGVFFATGWGQGWAKPLNLTWAVKNINPK